MKKIALFALLVLACFLLTSCSSQTQEDSASGTDGETPESAYSDSEKPAESSTGELIISSGSLGDNTVQDIWNDDGTIISEAQSSEASSSAASETKDRSSLISGNIVISRDDSGWSEWE